MRSLTFTALAVFLGLEIAAGQPAPPKQPVYYAGPERTFRVEVRAPGIRLGLAGPREFALSPLSEGEKAQLFGSSTRLRTGIHRAVPRVALDLGAWQTASDGTRLWRAALRSPGAVGMRLEFRNFSVGAGNVWIHDGVHSAGPYTGRGPNGDGHFWSGSIAAESVVVEYEPEPGQPADLLPRKPPFEIVNVAHQARAALQATPPSSDGADFCQLDANCYPGWKPAMGMVGLLLFEDGGEQYACSGSLVATRDNSMKPYLLTAGHCINSEASAQSLEVFWDYQTASCGAPPPTTYGTVNSQGADLVAWGTLQGGDYSLLLLKSVPAGVTFAGWDPTDPPMLADVTGIHHPAGSWKRISFGQRTADATVQIGSDIAPASLYLQVQWNNGVTQPGSSGSPLFTSPGVIVGTLTWGVEDPPLTACEIVPNYSGYARFSNTYQNLQSYLEDWPAATVTPAPASLSFSVTNGSAPSPQSVQLTTQSTGQVAFKIRSDASWIGVSSLSGQISATSPAAVKISVDPKQVPQPGQYTGTVTLLAGTAAPQLINVALTVTQPQSNVIVSINPATVTAVDGLWNFQIQLSETAGVATTLTAIKINGADYSSNIAAWFGGNALPPNGNAQATLHAAGIPAGLQFFEFWGTDAASGQQWYRLVSATFQ